MSIQAEPAPVPEVSIWRLTIAQYHEMIRAGILSDDDPVELLEGCLVTKMPRKPPHRLATGLVRTTLERVVPAGWYVDSQEPITLELSEPEPDATIVLGNRRDYAERHPGPRDLVLVVEVADASLDRDQTLKKRLYAEAGIPVYWILNLLDRRLEVFTDPTGSAEAPDYRQEQHYGLGEEAPLRIEGREVARIAVADLLP
jgi:Uma2 family endonuclease